MKSRIVLTLSSIILLFSVSLASENPGWIVKPSISPDGKNIAFGYKGEIFTVPSSGGKAVQLTSDNGYDGTPIWSPDGSRIVFLSNREGSDDIFITSSDGGTPKRLTTNSGNEVPLTFINDSILLFNATIQPGRNSVRYPLLTQLYTINVNRTNDRPKLFLSYPVWNADARNGKILFQDRKGYEDPFRKHERSSGTSDIILYEDGKFRKITEFNGQELSPAWGKGDIFYYISEADSTMNIYEGGLNSEVQKQLTFFRQHPVRSLTASNDNLLCFAWDGEVYTLIPGKEPQKVEIVINSDLYDGDNVKRYVNTGAAEIAISPSGNEVAFTIRGDLYVTNDKYPTTKRITNTPYQERSFSFSPDGKSIVFDSDVEGNWQLFIAKIKNPDEKEFAYATDIIIEPLYKSENSAMQPIFSPDGKKVAFLENRDEIRVIDIETKKVTTALPGQYNYSYSDGDIIFSWSPDSQRLLTSYLGKGGWNNADIAIVSADGSEVVNLTESGYADSDPKWVLNGKGVTYTSGKNGMKAHGSWGNQEDVYLMVLDSDAWDEFNFTEEEAALKEKKDEENDSGKEEKKGKNNNLKEKETNVTSLDFKNRKYRSKRLTDVSSNLLDYYLSPKGDKLYYVAESVEGEYDLIVKDLKKNETTIVIEDINGVLYPDKKGENLFVLSDTGIKKISLPSLEITNIEFDASYDRHPSLEREYIFNHAAKQVKDKFYDENMHGVDWDYYSNHYKEFLPYINNNRDFADMLSELLGELNASHTGARYKYEPNILKTSYLGAFFNDDYTGDGLQIVEIMAGSPLNTGNFDLKEGDIIDAIDGVKIAAQSDYYPLLEGKAGKKVRLDITKKDNSQKTIYVRPISIGQLDELAYNRWVERNEQIVDSLSDGKIGYVHVKAMDGPSFQVVYDRLLGKYRNCEAVVVDTRYNGGGWLHNDLAVLLSGKEYVKYSPRGKDIGIDPFSQWTKPSVMLVNEANYSDAHGTPHAYRSLGLGDIIGAPIPGTMTAVWWEYQIDPTLVFGIPQVTNVDMNGTILENSQFNPDVLIYNNQEEIEKGKDSQLEGAVKHLMNKLSK